MHEHHDRVPTGSTIQLKQVWVDTVDVSPLNTFPTVFGGKKKLKLHEIVPTRAIITRHNHASAFLPFQPGLRPVGKIDQPNQPKTSFPNRTRKTQPTKHS